MHLRAFDLLLYVATLALVSAPAAAAPIAVNSLNSFAIKTSDLPVGCTVERPYDTGMALVTCSTAEQFSAGFTISQKMTVACSDKAGKHVCEVKE